MTLQEKLAQLKNQLMDTGKRNNLINFKDSKMSSAELVFPDSESIFSKRAVGHTFQVFDPKIPEEDETESEFSKEKRLSREAYIERFSPQIKNNRSVLVYAQTKNPLTVVKNIAKRAKQVQDETGNNVAYLAFGTIRWNESKATNIFYRAPLLLVHVNILTGSILDPVKIEVSDDDVTVNPTFDYLLQAEYGMSLPPFEDGDTLYAYYEKLTPIIGKMDWELIDECKLGLFSFLKLNMYEDLEQNGDKVLNNAIASALLGEPAQMMKEASDASHCVENPLIDLHTVVPADSSQIEAIEMAKSGRSFVLQGPPGTGKSQTITNIIAERLHDGKTVLFVSEKQAALNVVYDKLKKVGLADACLELHSHKANKKDVIKELNRTLELMPSDVRASAQEDIRQKREAQRKLDAYAAELHKTREVINLSLYQMFELYAKERQCPELQFEIRSIQGKGPDYCAQCVRLLEQYADYVLSVGQNYKDNAWYGFVNTEISYDERYQFRSGLELLLKGFQALRQTTEDIRQKYETPELNYAETLRWQSMLAFFAESDVVTPALLSRSAYEYALPHLTRMKELSADIISSRNVICQNYREDVVREIDGKSVHAQLSNQFSGFFSRVFSSDYRNLIRRIRAYSLDGKKPQYRQALLLAERLEKLQAALNEYAENESAIQGCLGACYNGPDTDWARVMSAMSALRGYFDDDAGFGALAKMNAGEYADMQAQFSADSVQLADETKTVSDAKEVVARQFDSKIFDVEHDSYEHCLDKLQRCLDDFDKLNNWISFLNLLKQLDQYELSGFIDLAVEEQVSADEIVGTYRRAFYKQWIDCTISSVAEFNSFPRVVHHQNVNCFAEKDKAQYAINMAEIKSVLSHRRPDIHMATADGPVALLHREGEKTRKQMPIRKLLAATEGLVQRIKPCFLMSPLSVSTFLSSEFTFDTVIFDEASQVFPQDAIGAIYRGKQLIVVGDKKQMPPSNFFSSTVENEDNDDESDSMSGFESILDMCSASAGFSSARLDWHYRSHYEELIAFSNANFYENRLITFPSCSTDHEWIGVDYHYVDGTFDRQSKTNRAEAEYIVDLIYQNIEMYPERSLGVVAFSAAQQGLIDKLLSRRRTANPSHEDYFRADRAEPFFVKNLETVQGDERDTIIFSVAYARDGEGRFIQNFGPLNRQGGERRLNVAVTRAKDNVQLVASIHGTDIDISNTQSEGVRLLRAYLDYAEAADKRNALERTLTPSDEDQFDSDFEQEVCDFLREHGYTVDTQVGCSGYRIDLGLRKPESSNYVLAIECDGRTYHSSKNARDRDCLRQSILEKMGWKFYRIWSTDWFLHKSIEKERLLQVVKQALSGSETPRKAQKGANTKAEEAADSKPDEYVTKSQKPGFDFPRYKQLDAMSILKKTHSLKSAIRKILESEPPLSEEFLLKRITPYFGNEKVTVKVKRDFDEQMDFCDRSGIIRRNGFLYLQGKNDYTLHIPGDKREIKYYCIEELANGFYWLIQQNEKATRDGLYKTMREKLGFVRTTDAITSRFDRSIDYLMRCNAITEHNGFYKITT